MKNKWLICALGILSFVTLSAGSCDEDNDVDCDEETGAWTKCEDGKLKQCYKSELSGDYIYKSEKCESGECASETACAEGGGGGEIECNTANEGKVICTTDGEHAYYATCTLLVNPTNPSETSHAFEPGTKCEVYGSNKCDATTNNRYCASPEGGMSGEMPCGPENQGQDICVDYNGKGMIETCDEWSMQGSDQKEWFFNTSPEDCANGCNEAHNGCK